MLGSTVYFTLGGLWTQPVDLDHINFKCSIFGVVAYNEDFPDLESVDAGMWSFSLPFSVPSVAPQTTYHVNVTAYDKSSNQLFGIITSFKF